MKITSILLACLLLAIATLGWADPGTVVRVEVIVFQHIDGRSDRWPTSFSDDFSKLPDPLESARLAAWTARLAPDDEPQQGSGNETFEAGVQARSEQASGPVWPEFYVGLARFSPTMEQAASRLQASAQHRVLTRMAWLQPLERDVTTRPVRIRGTEPLAIDWTRVRPSAISAAALIEPPPADPEIRYRLDGSLHLRQRQFRHVDLDLVWRDPAPVAALTPQIEHEVLAHRQNLSRPIRLDRLEYFDSPWLGVLVRVEEWRPPQAGQAQETSGGP